MRIKVLRIALCILFWSTSPVQLLAQRHTSLDQFQPSGDFENIHMITIDSDPLVTTTIIWVKRNVKEHYHEHHSEVVIVLEGRAMMTLGEDKFEIGKQDYIYVPRGVKHSVQAIGDVPLKILSVQTPEFDGTDRVYSE